MSQWQNYGFPDLSGVHFQIALQGLTCAVMERAQALGVAEYYIADELLNFYENKSMYCCPIYDIVNNIDGVFSSLYHYVLPDGSVFSLENAAAYLKEDLIKINNRTEGSWSYADSALKYEWCMQRYRFINLAWKTDYSMQIVNSIYEKSSGSGETYFKAVSELERTEYDNGFYSWFEMELITERGKDSWNVTRHLLIPDRVKYNLSAPGLVCLEIIPRMTRELHGDINIPENALEFSYKRDNTFCRWQADDFGCGLKFNTPQMFFSQHIPAGTIPGSEVKLTGLYKHLSSLGKAASFPVPQSGYDYSTFVRGFSAELSSFCDFRNYFNFYAPPETQKTVIV